MTKVEETLKRAAAVSRHFFTRHFTFDETAFRALEPESPARGRVLLAHVAESFTKPGQPLPATHNNYHEARAIADTFLERGYAVDVISYRNRMFVPKRRYDIFFSKRVNFDAIAARLNPDCLKIAHLDVAHWLYNNTATFRRCLEAQGRRGVTLASYRVMEDTWAIEHADYATLLGNDFNYATYAFAGKPMFQLPNVASALYPAPEAKDFEACRRRFLWIGSTGLVHKGLDLVLEAFAGMPDHHLTVCGPVAEDAVFARAYRRELYQTPNIETLGWVDIASPAFAELTRRTLGLAYPSCSEACSGAVVNSLHAGLIPVVSRQCGIDIDPDFGVMLPENGVADIQRAVRALTARPTAEVAAMARRAWEVARATYSAERYREVLGAALEAILADRRPEAQGLRPDARHPGAGDAVPPRRSAPASPRPGHGGFSATSGRRSS